MITSLREFEELWGHESTSTLKLMKVLTDASLAQAVTSQDRNLGRIAWHITTTVPEMTGKMGLKISGADENAPVPAKAAQIAAAYEELSGSLVEQLKKNWTDQSLQQEDDMYGMKWKRGLTLDILIKHQTHHRGQMTVLMRQAGLVVPGVYGPAREEWAGMGAQPPAI